jgi:hypothetical protein
MAKRMSSPSTSSSGRTGGITTASLIQRESRHTSRRHRVELDVHAVIGKFRAPALCSLQDPRAHQQRYTRVNPFEITADTARDFADRQRPGTVMARTISTRFGRQHRQSSLMLSNEIRSSPYFLLPARGRQNAARQLALRLDAQNNRSHGYLRSFTSRQKSDSSCSSPRNA